MATVSAERLRSAYSRATWPALIVGAVVGTALGLLAVHNVGSAAPWGVAITFGVAGAVVAVIAAGLSLALLAGTNAYASPSPHARVAAATLTASVVTAMVSLVLLWMMCGVLWIAAIAGAAAAIVALGLALAAERRAPNLPQPARRDHIPSGIALWPLGAVLLTPIGGASSMFLLKDQLHMQCSIYFEAGVSQVEANGSWVCAGGISYLIPGIVLICGPFVFAVIGAVIAHVVVRDFLARLMLAFSPWRASRGSSDGRGTLRASMCRQRRPESTRSTTCISPSGRLRRWWLRVWSSGLSLCSPILRVQAG